MTYLISPRFAALFISLLLCQACSKTSFDGAGASSIADKSSNNGMELEDDNQEDDDNSQGPVQIGDDGKDDDQAKKDDDHKNCDKDDDKKQGAASTSGSDPYVACYLSSNSKWKLGISEGWLSMVNSVSKSVCIPESVCKQKIGKMFGISVSADRGYCEKNPNVLRISKQQFDNL